MERMLPPRPRVRVSWMLYSTSRPARKSKDSSSACCCTFTSVFWSCSVSFVVRLLHCYAAPQSRLTARRPCKGPQGKRAAPKIRARPLGTPPSQGRRATRKTAQARPHAHASAPHPGHKPGRSKNKETDSHAGNALGPGKPPDPLPGSKAH